MKVFDRAVTRWKKFDKDLAELPRTVAVTAAGMAHARDRAVVSPTWCDDVAAPNLVANPMTAAAAAPVVERNMAWCFGVETVQSDQ